MIYPLQPDPIAGNDALVYAQTIVSAINSGPLNVCSFRNVEDASLTYLTGCSYDSSDWTTLCHGPHGYLK